ncbi:GNAT family N-acetyltransferase [Rubrivivax sp. A210]|uniref:GNAT family N-acetyltransferase n=1 Tax=Rubrivivax sp. A210 TaxID=2772301 RepID=UPI00191AD46C|nr:GNAT family N-acetyltransferase [Rubrivivax sp. A210]
MNPEVAHNAAASRFELPLGEGLALCCYRRDGGLLVLHHTEVPPAQQGRGGAARVVAAALDWARGEGLRVRPACSYVAVYMRRHPETRDLLEGA